MSLLTICQEAARNIPVDVPTSIIGNNQQTATLLLASAQKTGKALARAPKSGWLATTKEYTFSTVAGTADYALPADFGHLVDQSLWDRSNYWELRGPLTPQQWQTYKSSVLGNTDITWKRFRIRNVSGTVKFSIDPTPTDNGEELVFEYVSTGWCKNASEVWQSEFKNDTDVGLVDEYLIQLGVEWRMLNRLGMEYQEEKREYEIQVQQAIARDGGAPVLDLGTRRSRSLIGPWNVPDTGYGS